MKPIFLLVLCVLATIAMSGNVVIGNGNCVHGNSNVIRNGHGNNVKGDGNEINEGIRNDIMGDLNSLFRTKNLKVEGNGQT